MSKNWPLHTKEGTIRIYRQNVNGVSYFENYGEWEIVLENLHEKQVDIACLTEMNLDLTKPGVCYELREKVKKLDRSANIIMVASKTTVHDRVTKRGGVMTLTRGNWSGQVTKNGTDKLGQWAYITLAGKRDRKLTIINALEER